MLECEIARNELVSFKENHVCSSSNNDVLFRDEFKSINERVICLNSILDDCVHKHKDLMDLGSKKNTSISKKHTHYAYMYTKNYKCTICGRKCHLDRFCFDAKKIFQKPTSIAPKDIWVP